MERYGDFKLKIEGQKESQDWERESDGSLADYETFRVRIFHDGNVIKPSQISQFMKHLDKAWIGSEDDYYADGMPVRILNDLRQALIRETGDIDEVEIPNDGRRVQLPIQIIAQLRLRDEFDDFDSERFSN